MLDRHVELVQAEAAGAAEGAGKVNTLPPRDEQDAVAEGADAAALHVRSALRSLKGVVLLASQDCSLLAPAEEA